MNKLAFALLFVFTLTVPLGYAVPAFAITLTQISTPFPFPIGIDHHEEGATDKVAISVNYPSGNPHALRLVDALGNQAQFSALSGVSDEVKIATVRSGNTGGFTPGDLFVGNGVDGQIVRISNNGATITNPWANLPGAGNGLMRGSLYVDRTGVYGDELIAVTTAGEVWRVNSAGAGTKIADVNVHLEGVVTVPNNAAQYGPLAGKIIAGAESFVPGRLYIFDGSGASSFITPGVNIEDIDHITGTENFYGVNFGTSRLLGAPASDFAPYAGEILLTQETHAAGTSGLYHLFWNGVSLQALQIPATGATVGQWEHVTFSSAGIKEIPPSEEVIGGEIIPINSVALLVAGAQSSLTMIIPVLVAVIGIGFVLAKRKF